MAADRSLQERRIEVVARVLHKRDTDDGLSGSDAWDWYIETATAALAAADSVGASPLAAAEQTEHVLRQRRLARLPDHGPRSLTS